MATTSVRIDTTGAERKLNLWDRIFSKNALAIAKQLASSGVVNAKSIAPVYSGKTRKAIRSRTTLQRGSINTKIFSPNTLGSRFDLPRYLAFSKEAVERNRDSSKTPRYMERTVDYLNKQKANLVKRYWGNIQVK